MTVTMHAAKLNLSIDVSYNPYLNCKPDENPALKQNIKAILIKIYVALIETIYIVSVAGRHGFINLWNRNNNIKIE